MERSTKQKAAYYADGTVFPYASAEKLAKDGRRGYRCQVCEHPERHRIEAIKTGGAGLDSVAKQFGIHRDALWRHMQKHVSDAAKIAYLAGPSAINNLANEAARENKSILDYLTIIRSLLMHQMNLAAESGKPYVMDRIGGRLLETLQALGRITGEISQFASATINVTNNQALILNSPVVAELQSELLQALAPYPDARRDVIAMFVRLDDKHNQPDMKLIEGCANA